MHTYCYYPNKQQSEIWCTIVAPDNCMHLIPFFTWTVTEVVAEIYFYYLLQNLESCYGGRRLTKVLSTATQSSTELEQFIFSK